MKLLKIYLPAATILLSSVAFAQSKEDIPPPPPPPMPLEVTAPLPEKKVTPPTLPVHPASPAPPASPKAPPPPPPPPPVPDKGD